jgi:uncharacterized damage-inducible protein DinB
MRQQYRTLAAYNRQVNNQFYDRKRSRGAFFRSIHGTLNHLLLVDRLWLGGFTDNQVAFGSLDEELYADFDELTRERRRTDADIVAWADTLTQKRLDEPFNERLTFPTWLAVTHFFNHQTHHRGQLSTMLSQCGIDYGVTDLPWVDGIAAIASAE